MTDHLIASFAAAMRRLAPFEPRPVLAVAVSGGADSLALALLADAWARARGGTIVALIVDHGLRAASAEEARLTARRLATRGIAARVLPLTGLRAGPALAARARTARYAALIEACGSAAALHLLLGHHAGDQAETVAHRTLRRSASDGLAGMAALVELATVRLLRPLLGVPPDAPRAFLLAMGETWVEDPSNHDRRATRARLRAGLAAHADPAAAVTAIGAAAELAGDVRARAEAEAATILAHTVAIHPEGFAVLPARRLPVAVMRALIQAISGAAYPLGTDAVAPLSASPGPATLGGVRLLPAGRMGQAVEPGSGPGLGQALLMVREAAAMAPPETAAPGILWDGRFRVTSCPDGLQIGALGDDAARFRDRNRLPTSVLRTLPAFRRNGVLVAVPHILYPDVAACDRPRVTLAPPRPASGAPFLGGSMAWAA